MKTLIKKTLLAVMGISLLATTFEAANTLGQLLWSGSCLTICGASAMILKKIEREEGEE